MSSIENLGEFKNDVFLAVEVLKGFGAEEIYIFGSVAEGNYSSKSDIDIAVKGLKSELFFKAYGKLLLDLEHNVDLIDLNTPNDFTDYVFSKSTVLRVA